jgi:hypothetical protein
VKPDVLLGLSAVGGLFSKEVGSLSNIVIIETKSYCTCMIR